MKWWNPINRSPLIHRLLHWEYWSSLAFYWPMFFYLPWLAIRARHLCFFSSVNPALPAGGLGMESKYKTIQLLPPELCPKSIFVKPGTDTFTLREQLQTTGLAFPLIAKPDVGYRGLLVRKVHSEDELFGYLRRYPIPFLVQEFLDYPQEVGIFYYRIPGDQRGKIVSLTQKEFLQVTGDGHSTVAQLILEKPRAFLQWERLLETHQHLFDSIPAKGQKIPLGAVGNHSKGTMFINGNHLIDEQLVSTFDQLCNQIEGFDYGRFDIKCRSLDDLRRGQYFKIIEVNGVCSEPTHIYDAQRMTYFGAVRTILRHWKIIQQLSIINIHKGIHQPMPLKDMLRVFSNLRKYKRLIKKAALTH